MKYFLMARSIPEDGTGIYKRSHRMTELKTGAILVDYENNRKKGEPFVGPLICELDDEMPDGKMPTFYMSPAIIGTKQFYKDLQEIGIDNIEAHPVVIRDEVNNKVIEDYLLLNIIGRVSCADMDNSDHKSLDESEKNMTIIDHLVLDGSKVKEFDLFLVHEDTDCVVISEKVYKHLMSKGYSDIYFEELEVA